MGIFDVENFMPHGHCYLWRSDILLMNVISDFIIAGCYFAIPIMLFYILYKRKDIPFKGTIIVFSLFVIFCGLTHIMEIINVWYPYYFLTGIVKMLTAGISVIAAVVILFELNKLLTLPSFTELRNQVFTKTNKAMKNLPVGILYANMDGKIDFVNHQILEIFGHKEEDLLGQEVEILVPDLIKSDHYKFRDDYLKNPFDKNMGGGRVLQGVTKTGDVKMLEIALRPFKADTSEITDTIIVAIKDVTNEEVNRIKLSETLSLIKVASYRMPSLLSYIDVNGIYKFVNDAYLKTWNISEGDIVGKHYIDFLPNDLAKEVDVNIKRAIAGEEFNYKVDVHLKPGVLKMFDVYYIPHFSDDGKKVEGVVVLSHDITSVETILRKLQVSNKQLEDYAFLVSHDLQAPVRHIENFVDLLAKDLDGVLEDKRASKYMDIIKGNTQKIKSMISGMLKIAALHEIDLSLKSINLKSVINDFASSYVDQLDIEVDDQFEIDVASDLQVLEHIFINLFSNSVKYKAEDQTKAVVNVSIIHTNEYVEILYRDKGIGLTKEQAERVFNPFYKDRFSMGLGLGMAIVKRSVDLLLGEIYCIPSDDGAIFKIKFKTL